MTSRSVQNRPMKFGERDRREFIVQNSEVSLVAINDGNANPVFLGQAKVGTGLDEAKWQIRKITYDDQEGITRVEWPLNDENVASNDYEFIWTSVDALTITGISNDNPAVVSVDSIDDLENGDLIVIKDVAGMTEVNFTGSNIYTVANIAGATFELAGIDSGAYGVYTSGGEVTYGEVVNYTYA